MMNRIWFTVATSALLTLSNAKISFAQTVFYDFTVDVTSGPLTGEQYTGNKSVDVTGLIGTGKETLPLTSINFNFGGLEFTEANDVRDIDANSPRVNFQDGEFIGSTYIVSRLGDRPTEISLIKNVLVDGFAIDNSAFGYVMGANLYRGVVNYTVSLPLPPNSDDLDDDSDMQSAPQSVPEPAFWLGFVTVGYGYWLMRRLV